MTQVESVNKCVDVNLLHYMKNNKPLDIEHIDTNAHHFLNMMHYKKNNINKVVPILKHLEYCRKLSDLLRETVETSNDNDTMTYNNEVLVNLSHIEQNGIQTTSGMVFSQYNIYTSTGRPSNRFGGINFAALNKKVEYESICIPWTRGTIFRNGKRPLRAIRRGKKTFSSSK